MKTKICTKCNKRKSIFAFHKCKQNKNGLRSRCKKCEQEYRQTEQGKQVSRKTAKKHYKTYKVEEIKRKRKYNRTLIGCLRDRFRGIKQRCNNSKYTGYKYYGERGIKCLFKSADEFVNHVVNVLKIDPRGLDIDRIDNNGNYEPGNIQFVTHAENMKNTGKRKN